MEGTGAETRLASYGSLAPGRENHHQLAGLDGHWIKGAVRGRLLPGGWGSALGYLGLIPDPDGPEVEVFLFESPDLPAHWARLDEFEGDAYRRVETQVRTQKGELTAYVYALNELTNEPEH